VARNYAKETAYENSPAQVKRREARNKARRKAIKAGRAHKGDGKEVDHLGYHRTGSLDNVRTAVVSRSANRRRQPPTKARGSARH
jgi:transposase InsO family protein